MFTRLQTCLLVGGCLVVIAALFVLHKLRPGTMSFGSAALENSTVSETAEPAKLPKQRQKPAPKTAHPHAPTPFPSAYFKLTVSTRSTFKEPDRARGVENQSELTYTHQKTDGGILVSFYSLELRSLQQGKLVDTLLLTRDKCVKSRGTIGSESSFDDVAPDQQEKMLCSFGTNIFKILLDEEQNEIGRESLARPGTSIINEGLLDATRLIHGPFSRTLETWKRSTRIPMEMGFFIDCPVAYTRGVEPGKVTLKGDFATNEIASAVADASIQQVSCDISGTETFDKAVGDYTAADLRIRFGFQVIEKRSYLGTLEGELELLLERVSSARTNSN